MYVPAVVDGHDFICGSDHVRIDGPLDSFLVYVCMYVCKG